MDRKSHSIHNVPDVPYQNHLSLTLLITRCFHSVSSATKATSQKECCQHFCSAMAVICMLRVSVIRFYFEKFSVSCQKMMTLKTAPPSLSIVLCQKVPLSVVIPILRILGIRDPFCFHWDSQGNVGNGTDNGQLFTRMSFNASDRLQSAVATGKPRMNTDDPLRYAHRSLVRPRHSALCEIGICLFEPNSACSDALIFKPWTVVPNRITSTAEKNLISGW